MTQHQDVKISVRRLENGHGLPLPTYQTAGAAGMDIGAAVPPDEPFILRPGERAAIPTGFALAIPRGYEVQVRPRSGLARKHGISVLNAPGTIDSDYRGEVQVLLVNLGEREFPIHRGERIAQLVVAPVVRVEISEVSELDATERGAGGFGSTGT